MRGMRLALVCTSAILFASVAAAQDPYSDFRVPEARSLTWLVNGSARWYRQYSSSPFSASSNDYRQSIGTLLTSAHRHAESEPRTSDLFFQAQGDWRSIRSVDQYSQGSQGYDNDGNEYSADVFASTTRYLGASAWGIDAAASLFYVYSRDGFGNTMSTFTGADESRTNSNTTLHNYRGIADLLLGPGYGRVRDVTGVFDMQVLEGRLEATGRLLHPLSPEARQRLAELFSVSGDFQTAHDRPDRYLWRDVERILSEDGAIADSTFDAWSLMRALEPATLSIAITRQAGWRVSAAYLVELIRGHMDSSSWFESWNFSPGFPPSGSGSGFSSRRTEDENHTAVRVGIEYHRPLGMRWQVDLASAGSYGDGPRRRAVLNSTLSLTNVLADRWVATAAVTQIAVSDFLDGVRVNPAWTVQGSAQLSYFFEDSWSITAGLDHLQARPLVRFNDTSLPPGGYMRQTQIVVGLTYRPIGRFEAPGLRVSERLAPGGI